MKSSSVGRVLAWGVSGLACSMALLVACGDDDSASPPGGDGDASAPRPDAATDSTLPGDAAAETDADADTSCAVGRSHVATVGAAGATVSLCGATLEVPAGALAAGTSVGITLVNPPGPAWFEQELSGPVFRFTPDNVALDVPAKLSLARDMSKQRGPVLVRWLADEDVWGEHEACLEDGELSLETLNLGTFGLMQDPATYPPAASGLGSATLTLNIDGAQSSWSVPGSGGYAVYEPGEDSRTLILVARRNENGHLQNLDVRMLVRNGQPASLAQLSWIWTDPDQGGSWSYVEPAHGAPTSFTLTEPTPGTFEGELHVVGHSGQATAQIEATFTATPEKFRPPPSYSCGVPEGDTR